MIFIFEKLKNASKGNLILPLLLLALALLLIFLGGGEEKADSSSVVGEAEKIEELLSHCRGVGEVKVAVSYDYYVEAGALFSDEEKRIPKISGIGVVCEGGGDSEVALNITRLLSSAYGLPSHKISVVSAK